MKNNSKHMERWPKHKTEGGNKEPISEEDLDKLFKGTNRIKSIDRKNSSKNKREDFESETKAGKKPEKREETIRDSKETEEPITEKQEELERPESISAPKEARPPGEKEKIFNISNRKWIVEKAILDAQEQKDTDRLRELRKEFWELNQQYQEASAEYHKQKEEKKEKTEIKEDREEKPEKVPTAVGIPTGVGKKSKLEEKPRKEKSLTPEEKIKQKEKEVEEAEQKMAIYRPVGWFRKKPVVQDLGYYAADSELKRLKNELKDLKKEKRGKHETREIEFTIIKKKIPAIKGRLTSVFKRFAKRDFGVIEQTKMEDEQKKLEKKKKKLEKRFKKLKKKLKK